MVAAGARLLSEAAPARSSRGGAGQQMESQAALCVVCARPGHMYASGSSLADAAPALYSVAEATFHSPVLVFRRRSAAAGACCCNGVRLHICSAQAGRCLSGCRLHEFALAVMLYCLYCLSCAPTAGAQHRPGSANRLQGCPWLQRLLAPKARQRARSYDPSADAISGPAMSPGCSRASPTCRQRAAKAGSRPARMQTSEQLCTASRTELQPCQCSTAQRRPIFEPCRSSSSATGTSCWGEPGPWPAVEPSCAAHIAVSGLQAGLQPPVLRLRQQGRHAVQVRAGRAD